MNGPRSMEQSDDHREAVFKANLSTQPSIHSVMDSHGDSKQEERTLVEAMVILGFLLKQGMVIRGHDDEAGNFIQLLNLCAEDCRELRCWLAAKKYLLPQVVNEQISLLVLSVLRAMMSNVHGTNCYALLADVATDVANNRPVQKGRLNLLP